MSSRNKRKIRELKKIAKQQNRSEVWGRGISMNAALSQTEETPPAGQIPDLSLAGTWSYTQRILEHLEQVEGVVNAPPHQVFFHWLLLVNNGLIAMPEHLQALVRQDFRTYQPTQVVQALYHQVDRAFPRAGYASKTPQVWDHYIEATKILFESLRHSMWDFQDANGRGMGPDIVGGTYLVYALRDPTWEPYPLLSWEALVQEAHSRFPHGEKDILTGLKEACQRTQAGRSVLKQAPAPSNPAQVYNWLTTRLIPAAIQGGYKSLNFIDSWSGTGARLLAMAVQFPPWAVHRDLVHWASNEPDTMCRLMTEINKYMWGLNGYYYALLQAAVPRQVSVIPPDFSVLDFFRLAWENYQPDKQGGFALTSTPAMPSLTLADLFTPRIDDEYIEFPPGAEPYWI